MSGPCLSSSVAGRPLRPATRLSLGELLPRQLADRPRAHLEASGLTIPNFNLSITCGISSSFDELSHTSRQIPTCYAPLRHSDIQILLPECQRSTCTTACALFTPSKSGQRSPPTYYRGCWHVVSRPLFVRYRHNRPLQKKFTTRRPSSSTRRRVVRVSPIAKDSRLLPPVGVWTVSQFQ